MGIGRRTYPPLEVRLNAKVDRSGGPDACWPWTGSGGRARGGGVYGHLKLRDVVVTTHRLAWELANGPIPPGMFVCHRCDNPPCCNPAHLFLGTATDNARDRDAKGRQRNVRPFGNGSANHAARLSEDQVRLILSMANSGLSYRAIARKAHAQVLPQTIGKIILRQRWRHVPLVGETEAASAPLFDDGVLA